jgi:hypothetical protein
VPRERSTADPWPLCAKPAAAKLVEVIRPKAPCMAIRLIGDIFGALDERTVVVPGTGTLDIIMPSPAKSLPYA